MKVIKNKDVLGNEIKVGDYIVYGAAKGRCAGLNIGRVAAIGKRAAGNEGKKLKWTVDAIQVSWGEYTRTGMNEYAANPKPRPVHLEFSERICVIPEFIVPEVLKEMMK